MLLKPSYLLALTISALIGIPMPARAQINYNLPAGQYMISAQGGGSEANTDFDDGHFDVVGLISLNGNGGANFLNVTLAYQDDDEYNDGITCVLTNPSDVAYTLNTSTGIGTLTLTVSSRDACVAGDNSGPLTNETGTTMTFNLYVANGQARVVSVGSTLMSSGIPEGPELIDSPSIAGTLIPSKSISPAGPVLIDGTGQSADAYCSSGYCSDFGHVSIAGYAVLAGGGALSLDLTLVYSDNDYDGDAFTCHIVNPTDLLSSISGPARKLTLTVSKFDTCYQTANPAQPVPNAGRSITFNYYPASPESKIVSTASTLLDGDGDLVSDPGLVATLTPASFSRTWTQGTYMLLAQGGATPSNTEFDDGHMDLAGTVTINGVSAIALNITLAYQDYVEDNNGITCVLTTPSDLTVNVPQSPGTDTLTLTVSSGDVCYEGEAFGTTPVNEVGKSITFNLYPSGNQARIASIASNLNTAAGKEQLVAPSIAGSFTPAVAEPITAPSLVHGFGQATDTGFVGILGHIALGGIMTLNTTGVCTAAAPGLEKSASVCTSAVTSQSTSGSANALDLTLVYSDYETDNDAMTCRFTTPSDVSYSVSGNVGTMILTVSGSDTCYHTATMSAINNTGNSIIFNYYAGTTQSEIVSIESTLVDGSGDTIIDPGLTAIIAPQTH